MFRRLIRKLTPKRHRRCVIIDGKKDYFTYCAIWHLLEYNCLYKTDEIPEINIDVSLKDYDSLPPDVIGFKTISKLAGFPEIKVSRGASGYMQQVSNFMVFASPQDTMRIFMVCKKTDVNQIALHSSHIDKDQAIFIERCLRYMGLRDLANPVSDLFK